MRGLFIYVHLRIKIVLKIFPSMLAMTLLLILSLAGILYLQSSLGGDSSDADTGDKASIGLVGAETSVYIDRGLSMLGAFDSSKSYLDFVKYESEDEAVKALKSGDITAIIKIPEGLIDKLLSGKSGKVVLILASSNAGITEMLIREVAQVVSSVIDDLESASFVLYDYYLASGITNIKDINDAQTDLLYRSLKNILARSNLFNIQYVETPLSLAIECYYLIAMLLLLLFLIGVMCASSFIRSDYAVERLLEKRGLGPFGQITCEYASLVFLLAAISALFLPLIGFSLSHTGLDFAVFGSTDRTFMINFLIFCVRSFPVLLLSCAMDIFIYELSGNVITGTLSQYLVTIILCYMSGVFYTIHTMPSVIRKIFIFLPTGQAMLLMQSLASKSSGAAIHKALTLLWAFSFFLLTVFFRREKLRYHFMAS